MKRGRKPWAKVIIGVTIAQSWPEVVYVTDVKSMVKYFEIYNILIIAFTKFSQE